MELNSRKLLEDMRVAGRRVMEYAHGRTLEEFRSQRMLRSAILREMQLLGEALERLQDNDSPVADALPRHRRFVNLAYAIRHDDAVGDEVVWDVVRIDLPPLLSAVGERV